LPRIWLSNRPIIHRHHGRALLAILVLLLAGVVALLLIGVGEVAFERIGLTPLQYALILVGTLAGSSVNIPVMRISGTEPLLDVRYVRVFWITYRIPQIRYRQVSTFVAVNLGGAVIPVFVSVYLIFAHPGYWWQTLLAVLVSAFLIHLMAKKVPGAGIVTPALLPPIAAALVSYLLVPSSSAAGIAYISGTLGSLIGADLTNLRGITKLGAPVVSIGGAGTFDGIFLTGVVAALLVSFL
jgi:uncharacterized membrane protein